MHCYALAQICTSAQAFHLLCLKFCCLLQRDHGSRINDEGNYGMSLSADRGEAKCSTYTVATLQTTLRADTSPKIVFDASLTCESCHQRVGEAEWDFQKTQHLSLGPNAATLIPRHDRGPVLAGLPRAFDAPMQTRGIRPRGYDNRWIAIK